MATVAALETAREELRLSVQQLWIAYFGVGGNHNAEQLATYLAGGASDSAFTDHNHIIDALNDAFVDRGGDHPLPYGTG
jgi:hypothetical protein